jgi:hypothetical protein
MSTAETANLLEKNVDSAEARPAYCEHFSLKWFHQWVKEGWKARLYITMFPIRKLSKLDHL